MKKILMIGLLAVSMCCLTACGDAEDNDAAAEMVIETKDNAKQAVDEHNEQVWDAEEKANIIEEELE